MNEQRQQAYFNLIQSLLNCRSHNEILEILVANQNLLDDSLVQKMLKRASYLLKQSELDLANRLMNIAGQQLGVYTKLSSTAIEEEYLNFLEQVLKVTADSRDNFAVRCLRRATPMHIFDNQKNSRYFGLYAIALLSQSLNTSLKFSFAERF